MIMSNDHFSFFFFICRTNLVTKLVRTERLVRKLARKLVRTSQISSERNDSGKSREKTSENKKRQFVKT